MDVSATVSANGISINYRFDGPEDGPVVMFSNSLISNYSMWDDQVEAITGAGYRMLRYDKAMVDGWIARWGTRLDVSAPPARPVVPERPR